MVKKRKVSESSSSEEEQYHVEVVTKARATDDGWDYRVKWAGYDSDANTWEPQENVQGCERLLRSFWKHVGTDNNDYEKGYTIEAKPAWIAKEKNFFAKNFVGAEKKKKKRQKHAQSDSEYSSEDNVVEVVKKPKASSSTSKGKNVKKVKKPAFSESDDDADDSDDTPLDNLVSKKKSDESRKPSSMAPAKAPPRKVQKFPSPKTTINSALPTSINMDKGKGKAVERPSANEVQHFPSPAALFLEPPSPDAPLATLPGPSHPSAALSERPVTTKRQIPSHHERQLNPKVKMMDMPIKNVGGGTAISTKARLAQSVKRTVSTPSVKAKPVAKSQPQKPNVLAKLSFRKNIPGASVSQNPIEPSSAGSSVPTPSSALPPATENRGALPRTVSTLSNGLIASPVSFSEPNVGSFFDDMALQPAQPIQPPPPLPPQESRRPSIPIFHRPQPQTSPTENMTTEADQFLASIMPPLLAAPMSDTGVPAAVPERTPQIATNKQPTIGRIPKKWKWAGELFIDTGSDKAERICNITMSEPSEPLPSGLRLSVCLTSVDSIRLKKLHHVSDLFLVLRACARAQQFAKVTPREDIDSDALRSIATYLRTRHMFTYSHLYLDDEAVAILLFFPSQLMDLSTMLAVPLEQRDSDLVAALIPWTLMPKEVKSASWNRSLTSSPIHGLLEGVHDTCDILEKSPNNPSTPAQVPMYRKITAIHEPSYHLGLRILKIPKNVMDFLVIKPRPYCIWCDPSDGSIKDPGYETSLLETVLRVHGATNVAYKTDVRLVFVHVGSLSTLHELNALAERRGKRPDVRFYTYGTHESVPPDRWGMREIYPLGGVVTFTPAAFIHNPVTIYELIMKIGQHPLWTCYILPSTVAMVARMYSENHDPMALFDRGEFLHRDMLDFIEAGTLSLLLAPPSRYSHAERSESWINWQLSLLDMQSRGILEYCLSRFAQRYDEVPQSHLAAKVEDEIKKDMFLIHIQPSLMEQYRRFVVIKGPQDTLNDVDSGLECPLLSQFDFKDTFFDKQGAKMQQSS